jgi:hypothetical protein
MTVLTNFQTGTLLLTLASMAIFASKPHATHDQTLLCDGSGESQQQSTRSDVRSQSQRAETQEVGRPNYPAVS